MGKRTLLLALDSLVIALCASLLCWRLTGLSLHEVTEVVLLTLVLVPASVHCG